VVADEVITSGELLPLLADSRIRVLDARDSDAYRDGHIPGAVNLHPSVLEHTEVHASGEEVDHQLRPPAEVIAYLRAAGVRHDIPVCVYDDGGGYLAARLWWVLDYLGHPRRRLLDGGLFAWIASGGPISTEAVPLSDGSFVHRPNSGARLEFPDIIAGMADPWTLLCDASPEEEFSVRSIPGSINIPYLETFAPDNHPILKSRHELDTLFASHGVTERHRLVCYCMIGYSAAELYFAARYAGLRHVSVYDGGMADWSAHGGDLVPGSVEG